MVRALSDQPFPSYERFCEEVRGDKKKPNRERLHLETSGFLHNKDYSFVYLMLSVDFFGTYFSLQKQQNTVFSLSNFEQIRK